MSLTAHHTVISDADLAVLPRRLAQLGLRPLDHIDMWAFVKSLRERRLVADALFPPDPRVRGFATRDAQVAVLLRIQDMGWYNEEPESCELNIVLFDVSGDTGQLEFAVSLVMARRLYPGFMADAGHAGEFLGKVSGVSPSGRVLQSHLIREACELAAEDGYREQVRDALARGSTQTFSPTVLQVVRQGLWLEHLVAKSFRRFSQLVWQGAIVHGYETDVTAALAEGLFLTECKDTSLGVNDFVLAAHKARAMDANGLFLVSTRPIHPNVRKAIDRYVNDPPDDRRFLLIYELNSPRALEIQAQLEEALHHLVAHTFKNWLAGRWCSLVNEEFYETSPV